MTWDVYWEKFGEHLVWESWCQKYSEHMDATGDTCDVASVAEQPNIVGSADGNGTVPSSISHNDDSIGRCLDKYLMKL